MLEFSVQIVCKKNSNELRFLLRYEQLGEMLPLAQVHCILAVGDHPTQVKIYDIVSSINNAGTNYDWFVRTVYIITKAMWWTITVRQNTRKQPTLTT